MSKKSISTDFPNNLNESQNDELSEKTLKLNALIRVGAFFVKKLNSERAWMDDAAVHAGDSCAASQTAGRLIRNAALNLDSPNGFSLLVRDGKNNNDRSNFYKGCFNQNAKSFQQQCDPCSVFPRYEFSQIEAVMIDSSIDARSLINALMFWLRSHNISWKQGGVRKLLDKNYNGQLPEDFSVLLCTYEENSGAVYAIPADEANALLEAYWKASDQKRHAANAAGAVSFWQRNPRTGELKTPGRADRDDDWRKRNPGAGASV